MVISSLTSNANQIYCDKNLSFEKKYGALLTAYNNFKQLEQLEQQILAMPCDENNQHRNSAIEKLI